MPNELSSSEKDKAVQVLLDMEPDKLSQAMNAHIAASLTIDKQVSENIRDAIKIMSQQAADPETTSRERQSLIRTIVEMLEVGAERAEKFAELANKYDPSDEDDGQVIDATNAEEFFQ